jgi:hypothetical protein
MEKCHYAVIVLQIGFDVWFHTIPDLVVRISIPEDKVLEVIRRELGVPDVGLLVGMRSGLRLSDFKGFVDIAEFQAKVALQAPDLIAHQPFNPSFWNVDLA